MTITKEYCSGTAAQPVHDVLPPTQHDHPDRIPVLLPEMFVSFLAREPTVNPNYERVKADSEAWLIGLVKASIDLLLLTEIENAILINEWDVE